MYGYYGIYFLLTSIQIFFLYKCAYARAFKCIYKYRAVYMCISSHIICPTGLLFNFTPNKTLSSDSGYLYQFGQCSGSQGTVYC